MSINDTGAPASRRWLGWLAQEPVLSVLALGLIVLEWLRPQPIRVLAERVDWQTVATLAGLLMLTKALELSGCLMWLAHRIVHHVRSERGLAMLLVVFAAVLSMWLTNDVALFVVVPLMVSLRELTPLPFRRLVIVVALAVNAGSIATPLGNPQNLFLWQLSAVSFGRFVVTLGPLAVALMVLLLALTACAFRAKPLDLSGDVAGVDVHRTHALIAAVLFAAFVLLADAHHPLPALIAVTIVLLAVQRKAVLKIDWLLLLIFVLMFVCCARPRRCRGYTTRSRTRGSIRRCACSRRARSCRKASATCRPRSCCRSSRTTGVRSRSAYRSAASDSRSARSRI